MTGQEFLTAVAFQIQQWKEGYQTIEESENEILKLSSDRLEGYIL